MGKTDPIAPHRAERPSRDQILGGLGRLAYGERVIEICVRCGAAAGAVMSFNYLQRAIWMDDLSDQAPAPSYALCSTHADQLGPPRGWTLADRRQSIRLFAPLDVA